MKKAPKVSIIVLTWNNYKDTKECLESLAKLEYPNYEIIVVDNASIDGSEEKLKREFLQHIFIKNEENLGYAGGNNVGIKYAMENHADYVLLLNNDVIVDKRFLEPLVLIAQEDADIGVVGPKVYYYDKPNLINFAGSRINFWKGSTPHIGSGEIDKGQYEEVKEEDYQDGCAILMKSEVINRIGLLDEKYFIYWEETDFCCRARQAGYKIMNVPQSKIWHKISSTMGRESPNSIYYSTRSRIIFMRKFARAYHWVAFFPYFIYSLIRLMGKWIIKDRDMNPAKFKALAKALKDGTKEPIGT